MIQCTAFSAPCLVCRRGGLAAILNNVLRFHSLHRLNESLLTTALYLLNQPNTRHLVKADIGIEVGGVVTHEMAMHGYRCRCITTMLLTAIVSAYITVAYGSSEICLCCVCFSNCWLLSQTPISSPIVMHQTTFWSKCP